MFPGREGRINFFFIVETPKYVKSCRFISFCLNIFSIVPVWEGMDIYFIHLLNTEFGGMLMKCFNQILKGDTRTIAGK